MAADPRIKALSPESLGKLAQRLMKRRAKSGVTIEPLTPQQRQAGVVLSAAQRRMWFLHQLYPHARSYHAPIALRLTGTLDVAALNTAINSLVDRHEILRTVIVEQDGEPRQCVRHHRPVSLQPLSATKEQWQQELLPFIQEPFDLARGPVWRARLWRLAEREHVLLLVLHHIACDGWSIAVMMRELASVYLGVIAGDALSTEPLGIQYADYAVWQHARLADGAFAEPLIDYWREALRDAATHTPLPSAFESAADPSFEGGFEVAQWPADLLQRCRHYASQRGATLYMVLMSAFAALLYRYGSRQDVVIGTPLGNRFPREVELLVGLFLETVPLRVAVADAPSFGTLLDRVKEASLQAERHRHLPFERIVEALGVRADPQHHPIFQVMLVLENAFEAQVSFGDQLAGELLTDIDMQAAAFAWTLVALEKQAGLWLKLEYQRDRFDAQIVRRALAHLRQLMESALDSPALALGRLRMLGDSERAALAQFNDTQADYPADQSVNQWFEQVARRFADRVAVQHPAGSLSYAELDQQANALAADLLRSGVGAEQLVAVCLPREPVLLVALLAILKAGGAWLCIDNREPRDRIAGMLEECEAKLVITHRSLASTFDGMAIRCLCLDELPARTETERTSTPPAVQTLPDQLAYVIFTSGTTARPKGVLLEHRGLLNMALSQIARWSISSDSRILQFFSPAFDGAVSEFFMALLSGGTLVMTSSDQIQPGRPLFETLRDEQISVTCLPPSVLAVLPDEPLPDLRVVLSGGEACTADLVTRWQPGRRFFNAYGPTEVTIGSSTAECFAGHGKPTIGTPFANRQMYVLDEDMQPLPVGVVGELYIGGVGVGRGYLKRPDLTRERFVADPFVPGGRLYRTGDMGRFVHKAEILHIEFAGRVDNQVKLRGFRVELLAVEAAISEDMAVRDAAVAVQSGQLHAFIVPAEGDFAGDPSALDALVRRLRAKLPEHMLPNSWTVLQALPLTSNGKVDRTRLLSLRGDVRQAEYVAPRDALEQSLAQLWQRLLVRDAISIHDDFFALGGHSLLVAKLMAHIEKELGYRVPLSTMFRARTIEQLAQSLRGGKIDHGEEWLVSLQPGSGRSLYLVHPVGGNVLCYLDLAAALSKQSSGELAVFGLQALLTEPYPTTLEALAARYVDVLQERQPSGPYLLAGWSFGGVVAFEMARQLRARGESVEPVALIDSSLEDTWGIDRDVDDETLRQYFLLDLLGVTSGQQLQAVAQLAHLPAEVRLSHLRAIVAEAEVGIEPAQLEPLTKLFCAHARAFLQFEAQPADVAIELFCASDGDVRDVAPWRELTAAPVHVHQLSGDHYAVLRSPAVELVAARLIERLGIDTTGESLQ